MIIRRGKTEGWLHLDVEEVNRWARHNGVTFVNASPAVIPGRGTGLVAQRDLQYEDHVDRDGPPMPIEILTIPQELVLSLETVQQYAKFDQDLRELLNSLGDFGTSTRGAILTFLLFQASTPIPDIEGRLGVRGPFTDYVKTLPMELLPTFWTADELQLLIGTTLAPAVTSKLKSLRREYDQLYELSQDTRWFRLVQQHLDFDDWLHVDAMFRSRALEFHGSCMIPGLDLASHCAGEGTNSFYDYSDDRYFLWLLRDKEIRAGDEIAISYGDEKGACEMLFSYGFIDDGMASAETLFLSLPIPEDDPLRVAKLNIAQSAPGFKIIDIGAEHEADSARVVRTADHPDAGAGETSPRKIDGGRIDWKGDFVWLLCVSAEDGLQMEFATTVDGQDELQASFKGQEIGDGAADLRRLLARSPLWDVYRLRAIVILQQRVLEQLQLLHSTQEDAEAAYHGSDAPVRDVQYTLAMRLRHLEGELLRDAYEDFESQKMELADSPTVQQYLEEMNALP